MHRHFHILALAATAFLLSCANDGTQKQAELKAPQFSCVRHIYNNSECSWTFSTTKLKFGNVYFGDGTRTHCTQKNGPCVLVSHTYIQLEYTTDQGAEEGTFDITDVNGTLKSFPYKNSIANQCPSINSSGSTGAVAFNDPANGDITAKNGACAW